jgi:hypothetical protein
MQSVWMSKNDYERRIRAVSPTSAPSFPHHTPRILTLHLRTAPFLPLGNAIPLVGF